MCGIAGIVRKRKGSKDELKQALSQMCNSFKYRGPDDEGSFICENFAFGMRRLSIIDLETGNQPIWNEEKTIVTVFNGEIYNYIELRETLQDKGHSFLTTSDTEVIVHAYEEFGPDFVQKLNGMFAIALYDFQLEQLFLYRDRIGIKPLYIYEDNEYLLFASEMHAFFEISSPGLDFSISQEALNYYFIFGNVPSPYSILNKVSKLSPGYYAVIKELKRIDVQYWDIDLTEDHTITEKGAVDELSWLIEDSVQKRLRSDVPVGVFLSGGCDSSLIAGCVANMQSKDYRTFSIGYKDKRLDEARYAKKVADYYGIEHITLMLDDISASRALDIMGSFDEPFSDTSAIPMFYVSKLASEHVKVVLSGDGGDELFSGYNHYNKYLKDYKSYSYFNKFFRYVPHVFKNEQHYKISSFRSWGNYVCKMHSKVPLKYRRKLIDPSAVLSENLFIDSFINSKPSCGPVTLFSYLDIKNYHPNDILTKVDRMSMRASIEARVPLLDYRIVEFAARLPQKFKFIIGNQKKILKSVLRYKYVADPELFDLITRPKHGFNFPFGEMVANELQSHVYDVILDKNFLDTFGFKKKILNNILDQYYSKPMGKTVLTLFCLGLWFQKIRSKS